MIQDGELRLKPIDSVAWTALDSEQPVIKTPCVHGWPLLSDWDRKCKQSHHNGEQLVSSSLVFRTFHILQFAYVLCTENFIYPFGLPFCHQLLRESSRHLRSSLFSLRWHWWCCELGQKATTRGGSSGRQYGKNRPWVQEHCPAFGSWSSHSTSWEKRGLKGNFKRFYITHSVELCRWVL